MISIMIGFIKNKNYYEIVINDHISGSCSFLFPHHDPETIYILWLEMTKTHRGTGYGTLLLCEVLKDAYESHKMKRVSLDDVTSRCHRPDNIYIKLGLVYKHGFDNSMTGNLRHILYGRMSRT